MKNFLQTLAVTLAITGAVALPRAATACPM
jgi:hypothetical protein